MVDIAKNQAMETLLADKAAPQLPKAGDLVTGTVISASKNEVRISLGGILSGVIRGPEVYDESGQYEDLKVGDEVQAIVLELENESGEMELSFRQAGHQKAWDGLNKIKNENAVVNAKILDANTGGLMVQVGNVKGFLPVSQLIPEHYPRVEGGDKNKILEKLKSFAGQTLKVKIMDANEEENKLIVSEKGAWAESQKEVMDKYHLGDIVEGAISGLVDFGAFVKLDNNVEGLVHISELAWQRIDNPREIVKLGDKVTVKIIGIDDGRISLSMKQLVDDPWKDVEKKYKVGQKVRGLVLKVNSFGAFVELDKDIHGLAHISELSDKVVKNIDEIAKPGDTLEWQIISIEPKDHRLGLSLKALKAKKEKKETTEEKETGDQRSETKDQKTDLPAQAGDKDVVEPVKEKKPRTKKVKEEAPAEEAKTEEVKEEVRVEEVKTESASSREKPTESASGGTEVEVKE